jgi:23S rRNA (cytosine1962-C5)-methyltransferase
MPWESSQYRLVDFGHGRKLEWLGGVLVDRPSPAASGISPTRRDLWSQARLRFQDQAGANPSDSNSGWGWADAHRERDWHVKHQDVVLQLKTTPMGHVGVFPEQIDNWEWLRAMIARAKATPDPESGTSGPRCLNLFAYTGGATLAMASAGGHVAHIDASRPAVQWARKNAEMSHLDDRPIRWIVEDARAFVERELRRGQQYEIVVLDPPSFGHGPRGQRWQLAFDLPQLLMSCIQLLSDHPLAFLWTGHSQDVDLESTVHRACKESGVALNGPWEFERVSIQTDDGRSLDAGYRAGWASYGRST